MAKPKALIDSRLMRPAGWQPPKMTEKSYGQLFDSFEGAQQQMMIAAQLPSLHGAAQVAYECHLFYTDHLSPSLFLHNQSSPWRTSFAEVSMSIRALLPQLEPKLQEFCGVWLVEIQAADEVNQKLAKAFAKFLNMAIPTRDEEFQALRDQVELYREKHGAAWVKLPEFEPLISQLDSTIRKMQALIPELKSVLQTMYSQPSMADVQALMGSQKIKDQLDAVRSEPSHKRAINKLNRLFKDQPTQTQSSEIYLELGFRHAELDEIPQAIESYTKSIELAKLPNSVVYFWRGELYYQQKDWEKARKDFEQAIEFEIYEPERERALQYIAELQSK